MVLRSEAIGFYRFFGPGLKHVCVYNTVQYGVARRQKSVMEAWMETERNGTTLSDAV